MEKNEMLEEEHETAQVDDHGGDEHHVDHRRPFGLVAADDPRRHAAEDGEEDK